MCFRTSGIPIWVMLLNTKRAMLKFCAEASQVLFTFNMLRGWCGVSVFSLTRLCAISPVCRGVNSSGRAWAARIIGALKQNVSSHTQSASCPLWTDLKRRKQLFLQWKSPLMHITTHQVRVWAISFELCLFVVTRDINSLVSFILKIVKRLVTKTPTWNICTFAASKVTGGPNLIVPALFVKIVLKTGSVNVLHSSLRSVPSFGRTD